MSPRCVDCKGGVRKSAKQPKMQAHQPPHRESMQQDEISYRITREPDSVATSDAVTAVANPRVATQPVLLSSPPSHTHRHSHGHGKHGNGWSHGIGSPHTHAPPSPSQTEGATARALANGHTPNGTATAPTSPPFHVHRHSHGPGSSWSHGQGNVDSDSGSGDDVDGSADMPLSELQHRSRVTEAPITFSPVATAPVTEPTTAVPTLAPSHTHTHSHGVDDTAHRENMVHNGLDGRQESMTDAQSSSTRTSATSQIRPFVVGALCTLMVVAVYNGVIWVSRRRMLQQYTTLTDTAIDTVAMIVPDDHHTTERTAFIHGGRS